MTIAIVSSLLVSGSLALSPSAAPAASPRETSPSRFESRREEIFRTLRGGEGALSGDVAAHLWKLAGELAHRDWTPPQMRVQVVVRPLDQD